MLEFLRVFLVKDAVIVSLGGVNFVVVFLRMLKVGFIKVVEIKVVEFGANEESFRRLYKMLNRLTVIRI